MSFYGDYPQIENGVGAVTALRERVADGLSRLPRLDGKRIGIVAGLHRWTNDRNLLAQLHQATGGHARSVDAEELAVWTYNDAGLLVGADIRARMGARRLGHRILFPPKRSGENGLFLDDEGVSPPSAKFSRTRVPVVRLHRRARAGEGSPSRPRPAGAVSTLQSRSNHRPAQRRQVVAVQPYHRQRQRYRSDEPGTTRDRRSRTRRVERAPAFWLVDTGGLRGRRCRWTSRFASRSRRRSKKPTS